MIFAIKNLQSSLIGNVVEKWLLSASSSLASCQSSEVIYGINTAPWLTSKINYKTHIKRHSAFSCRNPFRYFINRALDWKISTEANGFVILENQWCITSRNVMSVFRPFLSFTRRVQAFFCKTDVHRTVVYDFAKHISSWQSDIQTLTND